MATNPTHISLELSLPDKRLHAHAKGSWRGKCAAVKQARYMAAVMAAGGGAAFDRGILSVFVRYPDRRRRDLLNTVHMCKPYIDGLIDAGVLPGDDWLRMRIGSIRGTLARVEPGVTLSVMDQSEAEWE